MDIKRLITHFTYRIEPKPGGGFIAHATDPAVAPLEAATREELQQKIQANIAAALAVEFPGLKLPVDNRQLKFAFHVERTPEGGFAIHSADANAKPIEGATHDDIASHFAEKLIAFAGKHFMPPELAQALAQQGNSGDVKIFVNRKGFTEGAVPSTASFVTGQAVPPTEWSQSDNVKTEDGKARDSTSTNFGSVGDVVGNSPITPEASGSWAILRFLLTVLIVAALMYFFLHRH